MLKRLLIFLSLLFLLVACQGQETVLPTFTPIPRPSNTPLPPSPTSSAATQVPFATLPPVIEQPNPRAEPAQILVVQGNASYDTVDIYANARVIGARFAFGAFTQQPIELPSGAYSVRVVAGGQPNTEANALFETEITIEARESYVVMFYGDDENPELGVFSYDRSPLDPNTSRLKVLHAVKDAPEISLLADDLPFFDAVSYEDDLDPVEMPSGDYEVNIRAGSGSLEIATQTLKPQETYLLLMIGNPDLGQFKTLLLSQPAIPRSLFRVIHGSFDAPPVRILLDEFLVIENLEYRAFSDRFITFNSGLHNLRVESMESAPGDPPLLEVDLEFPPNLQGELLLYDRAEELKVKIFPLNVAPVTEFEARLSIINALLFDEAIRPQVDTLLFDETNPLTLNETALEFGASSATAPISIGSQTFRFSLGDAFFYETDQLPIEGGNLYTYVIMGRNGNDSLLLTTPLPIQSAEDETLEVDETNETTMRVLNALTSQDAIRASVNGEVVVDGVAYGFISDRMPMPSEQEVDLQIARLESGSILNEKYFSEGGIPSTLIIAGGSNPFVIVMNESDEWVVNRGGSRGLFVDALLRSDNIALNFSPAESAPDDVLADPNAAPNPSDQINYSVGYQLSQGQFEAMELPIGDFILTVYDAPTGETLAELFMQVEPNLNYFFILIQTNDGIELLTVTTEL